MDEKHRGLLALLVILLLVPAITVDGWALATLWRWFAVPTLGVPALSIPQAIGLHLMVFFLCPRSPYPDREWSAILASLVKDFLMVPCLVGIGWLLWALFPIG